MAKRRKRSRKEAPKKHELPGGFWRQVMGVVMVVMAVMLVMTWFGNGGSLLNQANEVMYGAIGLAIYAVPMLLVYLAVKIFRSEDNRLPVVMWVATILMVCWLAGMFGLPSVGRKELTGGVLGEGLNGVIVEFLNPGVAGFIYLALMFVTGLFILQVSPATAVRGFLEIFKTTRKKENRENAEVARKIEKEEKKAFSELEIKVNTGMNAGDEVGERESEPVMMELKKEERVGSSKEVTSQPAQALTSAYDPDWKMPGLNLFEKKKVSPDPGNIKQKAFIIKKTLSEFGIEVEMGEANVGPKVTQYEIRPSSGVSLSKILARDKELALNLAVENVRIEAPIPGTSMVGVEIPNVKPGLVSFRGMLASKEWERAGSPLAFTVGRDISGKAVVVDLAKMPHLLVAGATGSGKSVMTNVLVSSLLYRNSPSDLKMILIDPKRVEMALYQDVPHLLSPVISTAEKTLSAMKWAVNEMERRYTLMAEKKVKTIVDYNAKFGSRVKAEEKSGVGEKEDRDESGAEEMSKMPYIVIIIDEMADLMASAGKDLELLIVRIAQKGRAAGMHLVLATQRPEAKVITGLIKANVPGRIGFAVKSNIDSRIMIDQSGAEKLLKGGDMLLVSVETFGNPKRVQGAWASDEDIERLVNFLKEQRAPEYNDEVISQSVQIKGEEMEMAGGGVEGMARKFDPNDVLVRKAVEISLKSGKFSTANLQTWLGKGHGYVSGLAIWFESIGVIGPANGHKPRELLISSMEEFDQLAGL